MVIRNRLASLIYRALEAAIAIYALVAVFTSPLKDTRPFNYFSTEADIYVLVIVFLAFVFNLIDLIRHGQNGLAAYVYMPLTNAGVTYLLVDALGYWILYPTIHGVPWADGMGMAAIVSHLVLPVVVFLGWLLFDEKGTVKYHHALYFLAFPLFYIIYSEVAHILFQDNFFPYSLMRPSFYSESPSFLSGNGGWNGVVVTMVLILLAFYLVGLSLIFFSNLLAGKYKRIRG